jgi:hypothetical protein
MSEILGVLFAIFVGTLVIPKFADYQRVSNDNSRAAVTAQQQKQIIAAGSTYIQQNSVAIQASATATVPTILTITKLQTAGLPASFSSTNPYGQTWQVEVLQPTPGNLQALAMSTGGTALPDAQGGKIMAIVGASGGIIPQNDSGIYPGAAANAYGAFAGWTIPTANYTSVTGGHLAALLTFNNGQLVSNYLYRNAVPGQPQLNQMGTALDMNGNAINNASQVNTGILAATGNTTVGGTLGVTGTATAGNLVTAGTATAGKVQVNDVVTEGDACGPINGLVANDSTGLLLSCQSGAWKRASKAPNAYRYMFTSSQAWTVPAGVSSAFVTMAGGGGSGAGWRVISTTQTGHSGGYVFSQPVNLVAGETIQVTVGQGGQAYAPYATVPAQRGPPYYIFVPPAGDDGLGGSPGTPSMLVSPSAGTLLECDGGSGTSSGGIDNYSGAIVAGNVNGATYGGGSPSYASPNRVATGAFATANGPGACGPVMYGVGNPGAQSWSVSSGSRSGGKTPFGYGSGGDIIVMGCYVTATTTGTCIYPQAARDGVVFIDVLY